MFSLIINLLCSVRAAREVQASELRSKRALVSKTRVEVNSSSIAKVTCLKGERASTLAKANSQRVCAPKSRTRRPEVTIPWMCAVLFHSISLLNFTRALSCAKLNCMLLFKVWFFKLLFLFHCFVNAVVVCINRMKIDDIFFIKKIKLPSFRPSKFVWKDCAHMVHGNKISQND